MRHARYGDVMLQVSNLLSIQELKQQYISKVTGVELKLSEVRFFFAGKELKNDLFIYSYDINDDMAVQAMV